MCECVEVGGPASPRMIVCQGQPISLSTSVTMTHTAPAGCISLQGLIVLYDSDLMMVVVPDCKGFYCPI